MSKNLKWLKLAFVCSLGGALISALFSLLFYYGDWKRVIVVASIGFFIGLLGAPELDKKAFKMPALFQVVSGSLAGGIFGAAFFTGVDVVLLSFIMGGFIGWLAPFWVKHAPVP